MIANVRALEECIRLATAGARGCSLKYISQEWRDILSIATQQNVMPLVACALMCSQQLPCPDSLRQQMMCFLRDINSRNMVKQQRLLHLINEMENAGFFVRVLKGYSVSRLYAYPESRDSIDSDILIPIEQERAIYKWLTGKGFTVKSRQITANDCACMHEKYGKIEIHVKLYPELILETWRGRISEEEFIKEAPIRIKDVDGEFSTLGYTDQLLFLVLHMIKHFIENGLTIRMMVDVALHFSAYRDQIDIERFWKVMHQLQYRTLIDHLLWVMIKYGGFHKEEFPGICQEEPKWISAILVDLENGGYMGTREIKERHESSMEYIRRAMLKKKNKKNYVVYMIRWKIRSGIKSMFPSFNQLKNKHVCARKYPMLAVPLWAYHAISFPICKICSGVLKSDVRISNNAMSSTAQNRIDLFERMGML